MLTLVSFTCLWLALIQEKYLSSEICKIFAKYSSQILE